MSILKVGMYASQSTGANYLTFSSGAPFSIKFNQKRWDGVLEYSVDTQNWYEWDASEIYSSDNVLYLRGAGNTVITNGTSASHAMIITSPSESGIMCTGSIMTLLDHASPKTAQMFGRCFARLFYNCTNLLVAPELPAVQLAPYCYQTMFYGCTRLEVAPELPSTHLATLCYGAMFSLCTSLTTAPALPAAELHERCYASMFYGCTSLVTAPELPATTLAFGCYQQMFNGAGIAISETQTGDYQTPWRIPSVGAIIVERPDWNLDMLAGTSGTFTGAPAINTTYYQAG